MGTRKHKSRPVLAILTTCMVLFADASGAALKEDCSIILESGIAEKTRNRMMDAAVSGQLYRVDTDHSSVSFSVQHFPFSRVRGRFYAFDGGLASTDPSHPDGQILFIIKSDSVETGNAKIDSLIRSDSFFNTALFPDIVFTGKQIDYHEDGTSTIQGEITVRNITRPLSLDVEFAQGGQPDPSATGQLYLQAQTHLDRTQHGMDDLPLIVSERVELKLELYLKRVGF